MKLSSRKVVLVTSSLFSLLLLVSVDAAFAKTNVNVQSSGGTGSTDIVIECNGVKKEYHSDKAENVTLNCDDSTSGTIKNEVNISNGNSPTSKITPNPTQIEELKKTQEDIKKKTDEIKKEVKEAKEKIKEERKDLFEQITQIIRNFFKSFHF